MRYSALRYAFAAAMTSRSLTSIWRRALPFSRLSWSQEGEDLILARMLQDTPMGFYVDVGAHDPFRFSNTAYFYARGWCGLNIEPNPDGCARLRRYRRRDRTLNMGVGSEDATLRYYRFLEPALNTFDAKLAEQRVLRDQCRPLDRMDVQVRTLAGVLDQHLEPGRAIDFLTVDTEGLDAIVLASNDWERFRPRFVVAEMFGDDLLALVEGSIAKIMLAADYTPVAKASNSVIFRRNRP